MLYLFTQQEGKNICYICLDTFFGGYIGKWHLIYHTLQTFMSYNLGKEIPSRSDIRMNVADSQHRVRKT